MTSEPQDDAVRKSILASLAKVKIQIRPNKLRKIVCRDVSDTNWTQFQRVIDDMIKQNDINVERKDGEQMMSLGVSSGSADELKLDVEKNMELVVVLEVPRAIKAHLVSRGHKKQKNIEVNTKTKITYDTHRADDIKRQAAADTEVSLRITKSWFKSQDDTIDDEETAKKHLETAKLMILQMIKAYNKNPHHFEPKKAGGTMAEQEEAKRIKIIAAKNAAKKRGKPPAEVPAKKKRQKFY